MEKYQSLPKVSSQAWGNWRKGYNKDKVLKKIIAILFLIFGLGGLFYYSSYFKKQLTSVSEVIDGDTIKLTDGRVVRYIGIDAPELSKGKKEAECFAQTAKKINQNLVLGKTVRLEKDVNEMDRFGRYLAYVYTKDKGKEVFVNQLLLEKGAAEFMLDSVNLKYQDVLVKAAEKGHRQKTGLWKTCAPDKKGCLIKGNLDRLDKRWYHLPDFRHYQQTEVNLEHGDRWFCSQEEAQKAGFSRARE